MNPPCLRRSRYRASAHILPRRRRNGMGAVYGVSNQRREASMRENRIRTIWNNGGAVVNGWLAIPNVFSAETMANQGWDSLTVDLQHGVVDYQAAVSMLTAI